MIEDQPREPVVRKSDKFLGLTKFQFALACSIVVGFILFILLASFIAKWEATSADVKRNAKTLTYVCSVIKTLDPVFVNASHQIDTNFKNGTYRRLKQHGLLSEANLKDARMTLKSYQNTHELLVKNGACRRRKS